MANKTALVTGASGQIGQAAALALAKEGYTVIVHYNSSPEKGMAVLEQVKEYAPESICYGANLTDGAAVEDMFKHIQSEFGQLDVLVNNSGITRDGLILRMKEEDFDKVLDVNLKSAFLCSKAAAKMMLRKKSGSIINMSSVVGVMGNAGQCNYAASKAGLLGMTKSLARELAGRNIRVNAIAPGFIETDMTAKIPEDMQKAMQEQIPLQRLGQPEDVAKAIVFLAGDNSSYITGQVLQVDGGMRI